MKIMINTNSTSIIGVMLILATCPPPQPLSHSKTLISLFAKTFYGFAGSGVEPGTDPVIVRSKTQRSTPPARILFTTSATLSNFARASALR
jgi:hypothetical protein